MNHDISYWGTLEILLLSTMQVKKVLKNKQMTYFAILKEEKNDTIRELIHKVIEVVLEEF